MENTKPKSISIVLEIALYIFWPVMVYLGYKVGRIKFYIMIVIINTAMSIGLGYLGVPWYLGIIITYGFYLYFARKLIKELKIS